MAALGLRRDGSVVGGSDSLRAGSDAGEFVPPTPAAYTAATSPPDGGLHFRRAGPDFDPVIALALEPGIHARRADSYVFTPVQVFTYTTAAVPAVDPGTHARRADNYTWTLPQVLTYSSGTVPADAGTHVRRVEDFAFGERSSHRGDATMAFDAGVHTRRADGYGFSLPDVFSYAEATLGFLESGLHERRATSYTRVTIEGLAVLEGFGFFVIFGAQGATSIEVSGVGGALATGRRTDFQVVGLAVASAAGAKSDREVVGLSQAIAVGQRSRAPETVGFGSAEASGAPRVPLEVSALMTADVSGVRSSTSAAEMTGISSLETPALMHPEMVGVSTTFASGQRLFPRRRLAPGWIKIRARQENEWTIDPPPLDEPFDLSLGADSAWYGPFEWGTYTENFYPGDGYGKQLLELTPTTALFIYRYDSSWFPPVESPYYNGGERFEAPIAARKLTLDPETGVVTSGPEVLLASHPLMEGAGGNADPEGEWVSYPEYWSFDLVSTSPTETRLLFRFYDSENFYDFFPGRPALFNGVSNPDWGYASIGLMAIDIDWITETATQGPFNRLGGPIGLKEEYWGEDLALVAEEYYENPTQYEFWSVYPVEGEGDGLVLTQMLTSTRGVAAYTNSSEDYQLMVTTFDLDSSGVVTELDTYAFPERSVSGEGMIYYGTGGRLLKLSSSRIAILGSSDPVVTGTNFSACWSFSIDAGGLLTFEGKGNDLPALYGYFMGGEVLDSNNILFFGTNQANDWVPSLTRVHVPNTGVPIFSPLVTPAQMAHPDQDLEYFDELELGCDGEGRWVAVWTSTEDATSDDHLYARGGKLAGEAVEITDAIQVSPPGTDHYYYWEHWSSWLGSSRFLFGWLADQGDDYSIRTAVLELTGGS